MKIAQISNRQTNFGNDGIIAKKGALKAALTRVQGLAEVVASDSFEFAIRGEKEHLLFHPQPSGIAGQIWDALLASGHALTHVPDTKNPNAAPLSLDELIELGDLSTLKPVLPGALAF